MLEIAGGLVIASLLLGLGKLLFVLFVARYAKSPAVPPPKPTAPRAVRVVPRYRYVDMPGGSVGVEPIA